MWQQIDDLHAGGDFELLTVAVDAQGPDMPRPYMEKAGATFPCVVDSTNTLSRLMGFKAVPNGLLVDAKGDIVYQKFGGFDIRKPEFRALLDAWLTTGEIGGAESSDRAQLGGDVLRLFDEGLALLQTGDVDGARAKWRAASDIDPHNYVIHKQLWYIENPEKFDGENVDMAWQKQQLANGR